MKSAGRVPPRWAVVREISSKKKCNASRNATDAAASIPSEAKSFVQSPNSLVHNLGEEPEGKTERKYFRDATKYSNR